MSDGTHSTEDIRPEAVDVSEEPTIVSELDVGSDTSEYPFAGDEAAFGLDGAESAPDEDDDWPVRAPAKGIRLGIPAALLLAVALVAAGFWGGAIAQKNHGTASAATGPAPFAARLRNAGATGANGFQPGGATGGVERHHRNDLRRQRQHALRPHRDQPAGRGHARLVDHRHPEREGEGRPAPAGRHGRRPGRRREERTRPGDLRRGHRQGREPDDRRRLRSGRSRRRFPAGSPRRMRHTSPPQGP